MRIVIYLFVLCALSAHAATPSCQRAAALHQRALDSSVLETRETLLRQAVKLCPGDARLRNNLGVVLENRGEYQAALQQYREALRLKPDYVQPRLGLGDVYYRLKQWPLSLQAYAAICVRHPRARQRAHELAAHGRFKNAGPETVFTRESLSLLYDGQGLRQLQRDLDGCLDKSVSGMDTKAVPVPVAIYRNLRFAVGSDRLLPEAGEQLEQIAAALRDLGNPSLSIEGHSDAQPFRNVSPGESRRLNLELSQRRAEAVRRALAERGLRDMQTQGFGDRRPARQGHDAAAWAENRRVEIRVNR